MLRRIYNVLKDPFSPLRPDPTVTAAQSGYNKAANKLAEQQELKRVMLEGESRIRQAEHETFGAKRKLIDSLTDLRHGY